MKRSAYAAPWGRRVWWITLGMVAFASTAAVALPLLAGRPGNRAALLLPAAAPFLIVAGTSLFAIRRYEVSDDTLIVVRSFWVNQLPLAGLESLAADPKACKGAWKTMGNDGLFAMHGRFRSRRLGSFQAFVTNPENGVILRWSNRTVVVSPEHPARFVVDIERRLRRLKEGR
ncbi:MAG: hypothetical protein KF791_04535 [Verrucomicrobiae bacterium]|nr:hypothetical protein [Verrucomicrobiae bacterium]